MVSDSLSPQPLVKLRKYPHLEPYDTAIWNAWLDKDPWPNAQVAYDVHVGTVATVPNGTPQNYRRMVEHLSTLRIDVVVLLDTASLVIEIKPSASLSAIGQALGYSLLFRDQFPRRPPPMPAILTDLSKPDTAWLCNILNVHLFTLGRPIAV